MCSGTHWDLPDNGRDRVNQRHHEVKEEGALPFHKFLLEKRNKWKFKNTGNWTWTLKTWLTKRPSVNRTTVTEMKLVNEQ